MQTFDEVETALQKASGPTPIVVERDGNRQTISVDVAQTQRWTSENAQAPSTVGAIGISRPRSSDRRSTTRCRRCRRRSCSPASSPSNWASRWRRFPTKVGALVHAIGGGERDPETPISVVGASIIGGDTVDQGLWVAFWFFLAQLNFVLGAVNLLPLLPFDGGHIAIAVFEKIRNMVRSVRGMAAAAPVNYLKLMPATYVVLIVVVGYMLLTVTADLVNPIRLFQ